MKRLNKIGPRLLSELTAPACVPAAGLQPLLERNALVIDTRSPTEFADGHVSGTINIPLNKAFTTWAGWLVPYTSDFYLIVDAAGTETLERARRELAMIGLDRLAGYFTWADLTALGTGIETTAQVSVDELANDVRRRAVHVLDVRSDVEWREGHIAGAQHIPLGELRDRMREVPSHGVVVVHCLGGTRSAIAASLLQASGRRDVLNFAGGYAAWRAAGMAAETAGTAV